MASGDKAAFEAFYDAYAALAYTMAFRILASRPEAEDLIQEVFLEAWRRAGNYDPKRGRPEAWLITITRSRAIDRVRSLRRKDRGKVSLDQEGHENLAQSEAPDMENLGLKITLKGALAGLSGIHREVLELAYFEGFTQTEIAERLKIPVGTVKTRIRDGLQKLRDWVRKQNGGEPA